MVGLRPVALPNPFSLVAVFSRISMLSKCVLRGMYEYQSFNIKTDINMVQYVYESRNKHIIELLRNNQAILVIGQKLVW